MLFSSEIHPKFFPLGPEGGKHHIGANVLVIAN